MFRAAAPMWFVCDTPRHKTRNFFLSLYVGGRRCAEAATQQGLHGAVIDLGHSVHNNILDRGFQEDIWRHLQEGRVAAVGIDSLCSSWSLARRAPQWSSFPSAVRGSGRDLYGLPNLSMKDAQKVRDGAMYRHAVKLIMECTRLGIPGYFENPATSRIWQTRGLRTLAKGAFAYTVKTNMCQYGIQRMKPTTFLAWGTLEGAISLLRCRKCNQRCSATGKRHLQLAGISKQGFLTRQAQVYPIKLAASLVAQLLNSPTLPTRRAF